MRAVIENYARRRKASGTLAAQACAQTRDVSDDHRNDSDVPAIHFRPHGALAFGSLVFQSVKRRVAATWSDSIEKADLGRHKARTITKPGQRTLNIVYR
jgi:hypothetical protein